MGLIHLYSATSTTFDNNGTPLVTAREAVVKRDEGFQLTFSIPISQNELHKRVQKEMIVSAMTPDGVNYFRIWDIDRRTTDVKVTALQLLYSLDVKQINPFGGKQYTGDSVLRAFINSFKSSISPYTFSSSIVTQRDFYTNEEDDTSTSHNALAILNKITDNWSGELMLNGFDVRMISKLGTKTDALLYEHKNIASFSDSSSMNGIVTRIYATATYTPERAEGATEDPEPVVLTATVDSPLINQYAVIYEATAEYNDARTVNELRTEILKQYSEFNVDKPERTIDVDTNIVDGTAINFGDELVLKYLVHDVDEVIRCVGYEYDPISENYIGVTLGTLEKTFLTKVSEGISSSVSRQLEQLNKQIQVVQTAANGKNRVTYGPNPVPNAIEGDLWFYHPEGRPDEVEIRVYQNGLWMPAPFLTDQDRAEFDQAMTDHYDAALAEIERKDAEYKEIFDDYDEAVATMDQEISDAATKAQNALEEAGISTDLAQTAKDLADTAQADASTAITNANQAKEDASTAITEAGQAKTDASAALTQAGQAITASDTAKTNAQTALDNASQAQEDAQSALTQAGQAITDSSTAKTNAQTALDDASQATTDASAALLKAGQAITDSSTAKTNAQTALDDASTALTKAGQAITDSSTAKTNAQTALDDASTALTTAGSAKSTADALTITVNDLEGEVELKASQTEVDEISGTVSTHTTTIGQHATSIASKADKTVVDTLSGTVSNQGTLITQNATAITSKASTSVVNAIQDTVDTHTTEISQNATDIASKASSTSVNALTGRVSTAETTITQHATAITSKASQTEVDTVKGTVSGHTTTLSQHATAIASKASSELVNTIKGTVDTHTTDISQNATDIASKASSSSVSTLTGRVDTAESDISQNATAITQRVTTTTYNTGIASKENTVLKQTTAPTHLNGRLWLDTSVTPNVLKRSNGTTWIKATPTTPGEVGAYSQSDGAGLAGRLTTAETSITQTATAITSKADKSTVDTLSGTVSTQGTTIAQHADLIESKADQEEVDTVKGTVSGHTTTISQHATAIASKAESSLVNTIKGTVDTHTTEISQNATDIASKASSSSVNALTGRVGTAESNITQNATAITQRVTTATYNTGIASKENTVLKQTTAPAHLNGRLWLDTSATPNILKRSTGTAWVKATPTTPGEVGAYSQSAGAGLAGRLTTAETTITQTSTAITSKADKSVVDALSGTVDTHTTSIGQNATAIASKASSSSVSTLSGRVSTAETTITQHATSIASKASQSEVNTVKGTVSGHTTTLSQHATAIASKAESSLVNTIKGTVDTHSTEITQNATDIASKASSSSVNTLTGRVDTAESNISQNATAISQRVTTTTYNTGLGTKENSVLKQTTAPTHLNGRLWLDTSVTPNVLKRSTGSAWVKATPTTASEVGAYSTSQGSALAGRVTTAETTITQTSEAITSKADKSVVDTLSGTVSTHGTTLTQHSTAISSKAAQTEVDTVKGTVSSHTTLISQNATAISARLTTTQVNNLVDGKGLAKVTYVDAENVITRDNITLGVQRLEAEIDAIEVGAANILVGTKDMSANGNKPLITTDTYKGLTISRGTLNGTYLEVFTSKTPVLDGYVYTMSFYAKASSNIDAFTYFYQPNNVITAKSSTGQTTTNPDGGCRISVTDEWKRYWVTWEMNSTNTTKTVIIRLLDVPIGTTLEVAGVKLEKGNKATDYSQAPSELMMQGDFNHFKSELDIQLDSITTSVTDITKVGGRLQLAESKIQSTSNAVTTTVTRLDNMKLGARNLLQNSGNPQDIRWWNNRNYNLITPHKHTFFKNGEENLFLLQNLTTTEAFLQSDRFLVKPNTVYTLSFYVFNNIHVTTWDVFFLGHSSKAVVYPDVSLYSTGNVSSSNKADYFVWKFQTPPVIYDGFIRFDNNASKTAGTGANLYIGDIMLVEGTEPVAYQPAPEDILNTSVSQWTVKADEISGLISDVKTNPTGTITGYNSIKNKVDSMSQAIGDDGGNIAQMVMTNQLFKTTVLDSVNVGGRNLVPNSGFEYHTGGIPHVWTDHGGGWVVAGAGYYDGNLSLRLDGDKTNGGVATPLALRHGEEYTLSFFVNIQSKSSNGRVVIGFRDTDVSAVRDLSHVPMDTWVRITKTFVNSNVGHTNNSFYVISTGYRLFVDNIQLERGNIATEWAPSDKDFADQSQVTQLAGSWALTLKSGNDIKTQINASTDSIRLASKFIHLSGTSLIDTAVIKSAHIDTLNANKIVGNTAEFNTIRAGVLVADAVRAAHIYADTVFFDKLFSNTMSTDRLAAREAWIQNANIIGINADKITAGTISANRISTSSLANIQIGGTNLLGGSNGATNKNLAYWSRSNGSSWTRSYHAFYKNSAESVFYLGTGGTSEVYVASTTRVYVEPNTTYTFSMVGFMNVYVKSVDVHFLMRRKGETSSFTIASTVKAGFRLNTSSLDTVTWTFTTPNFADLESGFIRIDNNGTTISGQNAAVYFTNIKLERGNKATDYSQAPEDIVNDLGTNGSVVIHGGNIKADTLDVGAITGNKATFISTGFQSLNSQATINGHAIRIQNTAGEFVEMNNTPELRSDDAGGTAVVLGKGRVHFYDSRGYSKGYVGTDMHTAGSYDFGTFLSKGSGIYKFARMADATQTTYAYYTVKAGLTAPASVITNMVQNGYLPDGNPQQFVAKGNMLSQLNGWPNYPNWPTLTAGQQIRYKELTTQTTGDAYEDIWKFGPSSQGDWRIYFAKHATFEGGTTGTSDRRLKHDIEQTQIEALGHIESLEFKEFRWNRDNKYEPLGLIAQDSGIVRVADDDMEGIDIQRAIMLALKGTQELNKLVKEQAAKIKQLEEINNQ